MRALYEVKESYKQIQHLVEQGELDAEMLKDTFDGIDGEFEEKCENCALVSRNWRSEADMLDAEIKRLQERSSKLKIDADKLDQRVFDAMEETGKIKFKTEHFQFGSRKSKYVEVEDPFNIPDKYMKIKTSSNPDKAALKKALENGEVIEGVSIKERTNYSIK